jgi:Mechanosensitive ion channel
LIHSRQTYAALLHPQGVLLILVRKPYDIGDRVIFDSTIARADAHGPANGGWVVEKVDLYTTTVRLGSTKEYCTFANGSLSSMRIINLKRTYTPNVFLFLKFTMNVTQAQLDEFHNELVEYVKDRPREWIRLVRFRCIRMETELQLLEFLLIVQHRESWQSFGPIQTSKGNILVHAVHLQKRLNMTYTAPRLPVDLLGITDSALSLAKTKVGGGDSEENLISLEKNKNV